MMRLRLPSGRSQGWASQKIPITAATDNIAASVIRMSPARANRSNANKAIRQIPIGSAAARHVLDICRAGVVIKLSS